MISLFKGMTFGLRIKERLIISFLNQIMWLIAMRNSQMNS